MAHKQESPEVAATTEGAIDNLGQAHVTYDRRTNQAPKCVTFFLLRALDQIEKGCNGGPSHD